MDETKALLEQRAARFAKPPETSVKDHLPLVGFRRAEVRYALPLASLIEIRPLKKFCVIPEASRVVPGVFYHRGLILSGHDLHPYLGGTGTGETPSWVLVCDVAGYVLGILADEVSEVTEAPEESTRPLPVTFGQHRNNFQGLTEDGLVVLNLIALTQDPEFTRAL